MEKYSSTPLFTIGQEIADFLVSCGILSKAWEESDLASNSESFSLTEHEGVAYVAFPSFHKIEGFIVEENKYGVGDIRNYNNVFSDCLKGNDDKPAFVQQGALKLFLHIMEKTDFQAKLRIYTDSRQRRPTPIIFVGHSLGGAVATLATLWVLEKRLRQSSPFCITFGCPLVGDANLVEAVGRENWAGNFLHVVSKHDIVPRMLLAPLKSIAQPLTAIFPYWHGKLAYSFIQDACKTLLENVRQCTLGGSDGVIERSPYKPFGTYMFCSSHGAACIDNSETVLKMLHWTMRSHEKLSDNIVQDWLSEHMAYGSVLKHVIEKNIIRRRIVKSKSESSYEMGISLQLDAIGVGAQNDHTWTFFPIAGDFENHLNKNVDKLAMELRFKQAAMAEVEWYKEGCERKYGITYYDSMKNFGSSRDIAADSHRVKLAEFWDEVIEMWKSHELPSDFESQNKWINAGTSYRRLVEPLDIAHYYRIKYNGNYLSEGRPNRHKVLQKWMEAKEKTRSSRGERTRTKPASLTEDSCFWAYVEEAWKDLENLKQGQHQSLQSLEQFEKHVTTMNNARKIASDVFLEGSSFMMWWEEWKEFKKNQSPGWSSPLYDVMESESRFSFTVEHEKISTTGVVKKKIPPTKKKTPSTALVKEKIPITNEESPSTDMVKEEIPVTNEESPPSTAVVKEKIPVTKVESPSIYVVKEKIPSTKEENLSSMVKEKIPVVKKKIPVTKEESPSTGVVKEEIPLPRKKFLYQERKRSRRGVGCSLRLGEERNSFTKEESPSTKEESPSTDVVKEESPSTCVVKEEIPSSKEESPSTGGVIKNIPSTKEIDCAQLRKRETELIRVQGGMFELEWYKMICHEKGDGYYDTFKSDISSTNAILRREELNKFWDEIIGMCESLELPHDFQSRNKWINAGTVYRKLVEPLDIAHYYRMSKGKGNYLSDGRPTRHKVLQKWLEGRKSNLSSRDQKTRTKLPYLTRDSCFWAHVEEALKDLKKGAWDQKFEGYVTEMINDRKISSDVFVEGSNFMKWWQDYKQIQSSEWKSNSPLHNLMESEFWKRSKPFLQLSEK